MEAKDTVFSANTNLGRLQVRTLEGKTNSGSEFGVMLVLDHDVAEHGSYGLPLPNVIIEDRTGLSSEGLRPAIEEYVGRARELAGNPRLLEETVRNAECIYISVAPLNEFTYPSHEERVNRFIDMLKEQAEEESLDRDGGHDEMSALMSDEPDDNLSI